MYISVLVNTEPVNIGRDGADEPPTLIKEDLLSSGSVSQGPSGAQVPFYENNQQRWKMTMLFLMEITWLFHFTGGVGGVRSPPFEEDLHKRQ